MSQWTKDQIAARVARDITDGAVVNLGIGLPTRVANHRRRARATRTTTSSTPASSR